MGFIQDNTGDVMRLAQIIKVINKYKLNQGLTPENVCGACKELGTAFIKMGQMLSIHPEVIPIEYCQALSELRTDAVKLTTAQMRDIVEEELGQPWYNIFSEFKPFPIGAASMAQVHEATLVDGRHVAVKIQRPDAKRILEQDIRLGKKAFSFIKIKAIQDIMYLINNALDETLRVGLEELDFIHEAENMDKIKENSKEMKFIKVPEVYHEYVTTNVLVMEYIGGCDISDHETLLKNGYDLNEICQKLIRSYIKQFAEDLFFHADPHAGNIKICDGQICWLDLGMMGEISIDQADGLRMCMRALLINDYEEFTDGALKLMGYQGEHPQRLELASKFKSFVDVYRKQTIQEMNVTGTVFVDMMQIGTDYNIIIPRSLTMYGRSLLTMEGTVADLDKDINLEKILAKHLAAYSIATSTGSGLAKKLSHKKLVSGTKLKYNKYAPTEEEIKEAENVENEELIPD